MTEHAHKRPDQMSGGLSSVSPWPARWSVNQAGIGRRADSQCRPRHGYRILNLMKSMRDEFGTSFIFSTHDPKIMNEAELTFTLEDGRLNSEGVAHDLHRQARST